MKSIKVSIACLLLFMGFKNYYSQTNAVTQFYGENNNGSLYNSSTSPNPDHNLHVISIRYNNINYSTGVNDELLRQNNITFVKSRFRSLPVTDRNLTRTGVNNLVLIPAMLDGSLSVATNPTTYSNGLNLTTPARLKTLLEDGKKGLNITTGYANITKTQPIEIPIDFNIDPLKIGDGIPDILISQIAGPDNNIDKLKFVDQAGNTVGTEISFNFTNSTTSPALATYHIDIFYPDNYAVWSRNTTREIRLIARDFQAFNITSSNVGNIKKLVYTLSGTSDPGFIAYNEDSLPFLQAEDDTYTTYANGTFNFKPLENDTTLPIYDVPSISNVQNGRVKINRVNNEYVFTYIPNKNFKGTETFTYTLSRTLGNTITTSTATITIKVLPTRNTYINPHLKLKHILH